MVQYRRPQNTKIYTWTHHAAAKMRYYRLSENLIKRVVRYPARTEEGVIEEAIAAMRPTQSEKEEIWTMYSITNGKITIITAWRYPGKSPKRNPIPQNILNEARSVLFMTPSKFGTLD